MWRVLYKKPFYYIVNDELFKEIKVKPLTVQEIKEERYQRYYDKAYIECEKANGKTVYLSRFVNGKRTVYRYMPKNSRC